MSNTDLKLEYGAANLNLLSEYDRNYTELVRTLYLWGKVLYDNNKISEAKQVLEYAVSINCDISQIYFILADIYVECHETGSIYNLIKKANGLNSLLKNSIVNKLNRNPRSIRPCSRIILSILREASLLVNSFILSTESP